MSDFINTLIKTSLDDFYLNSPITLSQNVNRSQLEQSLTNTLNASLPTKLTLASDKPSFEQICFALVQELQTIPAWTDIIPSGSGQSLIRGIAAGFSMLHYSIERTAQELTLRGNSESAVFNIMNMLGVRIQRNIPAKVKVRLTRTDVDSILSIPRFSKFIINNISFFNREIIVFNRFNLSIETTLYQGDIYSGQAFATGLNFEKVSIGEDNKLMSDQDIYVFVNGREWKKIEDKIWLSSDEEEIFLERTLPNGNVEIMFGNGITGKKLLPNDSVLITWAENEGSLHNNSISSLDVKFDAPSGVDLSGITISSIYGGDTIKDFSFYKDIGPILRPSSYVVSRREDYKAAALRYPGVLDALFEGQAEINPSNRYFMNILNATLITSTTWTSQQWEDFMTYIQAISVYKAEIVRVDPVVYPWTIQAEIGCAPQTDLNYIENYLKELCSKKFGIRRGSLGYSVLFSDIAEVLHGENLEKEKIETVRLLSNPPVELTNKKSYLRLDSVTLTVGYSTRSYNGRVDLIGGNIV